MNVHHTLQHHDPRTLDPSFLLAFFVDKKAVGNTFINWPLHITIIPWFFVHDIDTLDAKINRISKKFFKLSVTGRELTKYGERTVCLVSNEYTLQQIHRAVYTTLQMLNARFIDTRYFGDNYTPHITWQESEKYLIGDVFDAAGFYLVKRHKDKQTGRYIKTIAQEYSFNA